jgi:prolyl-tRNA editing enzyme YbaK/EbsC (Cys-tRNA(Pro) deacylase)
MPQSLSPSAQKVQDALLAHGLDLQVLELPSSTRTAVEAARAVGCDVGQIVKSLVFRGVHSGSPVLLLVSGSNRVNEQAVAGVLGEPIGKADADFVRQHTGFVIGGVPPVGHSQKLRTLVDEDLLQYDQIWAAAGTPNALFQLRAQDLLKISAGQVCKIN